MNTHILDNLMTLYRRDLNRVKQEILLYKNTATLWKTDKSITNSGGNLCLHLIGNLKAFIGDALAQTGYSRDRDFEFSGKDVTREKLIKELDETIEIVYQALKNLDPQQLEEDFPIKIWQEKTGMLFTLLHLHSHLNYHLGQLSYHRRFFD